MPTPKWKLVVDVGSAPPTPDDGTAADKRLQEVLNLLAEHTPTHRNSPYSPYLPGFTSLRLLLLKRKRTSEENDLLTTILDSYSSYLSSGRNNGETAWMIARDYMLLTQPTNQQSVAMPQSRHSIHQQHLAQQQQAQQQQAQQQQAVQQRMQSFQSQVGHNHQGGNQQQSVGAAMVMQQLHQATNGLQNSFQQQQQQLQHLEALQQQAAEIQRRASGAFQQQQKQDLSSHPSNARAAPSLGSSFLSMGVHGGQGALSSLSPHSAQNAQNGIAALSQIAQHHQHSAFQSLGQGNGLAPHPQDKSGVPGAS